MRLILIRHGETASNVAGLLDTAPPGPGLTAAGRRQAAAIPAALVAESIDAIFASNQLRAGQTAAPLAAARGLGVAVLPGLREIAAGDLEMAGDADSIHRYLGTVFSWLDGDLALRIPGGPNGFQMLERFDAAIDDIVAAVGSSGSAVAMSHGAAIRVWAGSRAVGRDSGFPRDAQPGAGRSRHLDNTGAVVLERGSAGDWRVVSWHSAAIGGVTPGAAVAR